MQLDLIDLNEAFHCLDSDMSTSLIAALRSNNRCAGKITVVIVSPFSAVTCPDVF